MHKLQITNLYHFHFFKDQKVLNLFEKTLIKFVFTASVVHEN